MGQTFRLILLVSFCYITYLLFELTLLFTLVPDYCWKLPDYWLNPSQYHNPFWLFSSVFFLIFLWALMEFSVLLIEKNSPSIKLEYSCRAFSFCSSWVNASHFLAKFTNTKR